MSFFQQFDNQILFIVCNKHSGCRVAFFEFFSATVSNMQAKIENLSATNALTKEDLTICKKALFKSQEENHRLLNQLETVNKELSLRQKRKSGNSEVISSSNSESSNSPSTSGDRTLSKVQVAISSIYWIMFQLYGWYSLAYLFYIFLLLVFKRLLGSWRRGAIIRH